MPMWKSEDRAKKVKNDFRCKFNMLWICHKAHFRKCVKNCHFQCQILLMIGKSLHIVSAKAAP
jgi:hypothetical protein